MHQNRFFSLLPTFNHNYYSQKRKVENVVTMFLRAIAHLTIDSPDFTTLFWPVNTRILMHQAIVYFPAEWPIKVQSRGGRSSLLHSHVTRLGLPVSVTAAIKKKGGRNGAIKAPSVLGRFCSSSEVIFPIYSTESHSFRFHFPRELLLPPLFCMNEILWREGGLGRAVFFKQKTTWSQAERKIRSVLVPHFSYFPSHFESNLFFSPKNNPQ